MRMTYYAGWLNVALGLAFMVGSVVAGYPLFGVIMLVSLSGSGAFMIWLASGWDKPLEDASELYRYGRPANAVVKKVEAGAPDARGGRTAKLSLHVTPRNESAYDTTRTVALPGGRVPAVGETVTIKFDPQSRKNFVLEEQSYEVKDQVQAAMSGSFFTGTPQA